jgi:hypothetical protein
MNRYLKTVLTILSFAVDIFYLKSQPNDPYIDTLKGKLSTYCKAIPFEDIYIHSDRETYIAGEYFWFNAYLFNRQSLALSSESSFAYIELLDPGNQPVSQTKIRLENGSGGGGFMLPDSLSSGEYTLRAYTNWMKNFLPDGCFMETITIYNPFSENLFKKKTEGDFPDNSDYNLAFYPEGDRLLSGFINKVGVRVYSKSGEAKTFKGYLSDGIKDSLITVVVDSSGIGAFEFFAEPGKSYKLKSKKDKNIFPLPLISQTGFSLSVKKLANDSLKITVNSTIAETGSNYFYLVIQVRGNILFGTREYFSGKNKEFLIAGNELSPGINQISVFDSGGNPVCNRLVFKPFPLSDQSIIKTGEKFGRREKISLEIDLDTNLISEADRSNFSLSVSAKNGPSKNPDISDYIIAGNEFSSLNGENLNRIHFFKLPPETIDNYLLSIKSKWINWENVIHLNLPKIKYPFEKQKQYLSGFYRSRNKSESYYDKKLYLSVPGKIPLFKYAETDNENRFVFAIRDYETSNEYVIQPADTNDNFSLQIESRFSDKYPTSGYFTDSLKNSITDEVVNWSINYQVEKIYGNSSLGDTTNSVLAHSRPIRFYGKPDQELIMSDYISLPVMQEVFFELIPGVIVKMNKSKYSILVRDPFTGHISENPPLLLVDGVIIDNPSIIMNLDPELVAEIDIIKSKYIIGDVVFNGIISVITKAGDFSNLSLPTNSTRVREKSFDFARKYKSPDYSSVFDKTDRVPDLRNTLYWNPNLKPGSKGKINVDAFTSDFATDYEINLQGASGGNLFSIKKTIRVE